MSNTTSGLPFPSGGKVIVISMNLSAKAKLRFGADVLWKDPWDFLGDEPLPEGVVGVILPYALKTDAENQMRGWARKKKLPIGGVHSVANSAELEKDLNRYFKNLGSNSGNGNGNGTSKAATPIPNPVTKILHPATTVITPSPPRPTPTQKVELSKVTRTEEDSRSEFWVKTSRVRPFNGQPRENFSPRKIAELVTSIKAVGQITAIIVHRIHGDPNFDYELIEGERRLRACTEGGIEMILATVREITGPEDHFKKSFVANLQREGYTPLEQARSIDRMMKYPEYVGLGKMEALTAIGALCGKTSVWAFNYLKLLTLPKEIQDMLEPNKDDRSALPQSMGLFLASIQSREIQLEVCRQAIEKDLSTAQAKHLARKLAAAAGVTVGDPRRSPHEDYTILRNYLLKANQSLEHIVDMPHRAVGELFLNRPLADRQDILKKIDAMHDWLKMLRDKVELRVQVKEQELVG